MANLIDIIINATWRGGRGAKRAQQELRGVDKASRGAASGMGDAAKQTSALHSSLRTLVGAGALLAAGRSAANFAKESLQVASSVEEMSSLIRTSLGPAAADFQADMANIADVTNRSRFALEEGASTIVAMSRSMGMGQEEAAEFAASLTQAGVDLGSFFNRETESVFRDIQAALGGSSETMQKYGIDVRETTLKQMALERGLSLTGGTLDRVQRAWLIQESIMEQASDAMGDAERTADSYENTMRGLEASTMDLKVALGTALIPTVKDFAVWLGIAADNLNVTAQAMSGVMGKEVDALIERNMEAAKTTQDYIAEAERIADVATIWGGLGPRITGTQDEIQAGLEDNVRGIARTSESYEGYLEILNSLPVRVGNAAFHIDGLTEEFYKHERGVLAGIDADRKFFNQQQDVNAVVEEGAAILATYTERSEERSNMTAMEEALLLDVGDATRVYNDLTGEATEITDEYGRAVGQTSEELREAEEAQQQANIAFGQDFVGALGGAILSLDDYERQMVEAAAASGLGREELVLLTAATGDFTEAEIEAALKTAAMTDKAGELGAAVAEGTISIQGAIEELGNFQAQLDEDYTITYDDQSVQDGLRRADELADKIAQLDNQTATMTVNVNVNQHGTLPRDQPGFQHGGSFRVGGSGPPDSQFVGFWATPGERVTIDPPGRTARPGRSDGSGSGNQYILNVYNNASSEDVAADFRMMEAIGGGI